MGEIMKTFQKFISEKTEHEYIVRQNMIDLIESEIGTLESVSYDSMWTVDLEKIYNYCLSNRNKS